MRAKNGNIWLYGGYKSYQQNTATVENSKTIPIYSDGSNLTDYSFEGQCNQASTPTPVNPVEVECFGDLIASGDDTGKYDIPITSGGVANHIILSEPLCKKDNYADSLKSEGVVTRRIGKIVLTGDENFTKESLGDTSNRYHGVNILNNCGNNMLGICTHYKYEVANTYGNLFISSNKTDIFILDSSITSATDLKTFLAQQYTNGTPVTLYYVLATPTIESYSKNIFTPAAAQTTTLNGITCVSDGQGRYSLSGTSSAVASFEFPVPEFTVPESVGNGGTGTFSIFNDLTQRYISLQLYNDSTKVTEWICDPQSRTSTAYSEMSNKKVNKIVIRISNGVAISGTAHLSPMITNDSTLPSTFDTYRVMPTIPTSSGYNNIEIGTSLAPSKFTYDLGKMFMPQEEKVRVNGEWI